MNLRLQAKYSIYIVSLIVAIVSILVGALLYQFRSSRINLVEESSREMTTSLMNQMEKRGEAITRVLAENLINSVYDFDTQSMFELLDATLQQKDVLYTYVYDTDGKIVHDGFEKIPEFGKILDDEESRNAIHVRDKLITRIHSDVITVSMPIWIGDTPLGGVKIGMSLKRINEDIDHMTDRLNDISSKGLHRNIIVILVMTLGFIALGVIFSLIVAGKLIVPIRKLGKYAKQVSHGDYDFQIASEYRDEIGDLINAFNEMGHNLKQHEAALRKAHDGLEQRVDERTEELLKTAEELKQEIAERKQTEAALQESEEKYGAVVKQASEGIFLLDPETKKILEANHSFQNMLGYTPEEISKLEIYDLVAHDKTDIDHNINKTVSKKYFFVGERKYRRKDSSILNFEVRGNLITFGERDVLCITVRDITVQKQMEENSARLKVQLQRVEKMEAIGTLAGGVAHDLNNILSGLVSYPELLLMDLPEDSPLRKPILTMQRSGQRAAVVVQDLLTLARRAVAVTDVVNLNHTISEYLKSPEHEKLKLYHPDVHLDTDLDKNLLNIMGSPVHLSKTIMNMVYNATEAMPDGGTILISTSNQYVDRPISGYDEVEEGDYAVLKVSDTGIGITSEDIEKIFEPFYTKKVMGRSGTGLGMAVVWGTVKDHNGYIDVQSTEGKGSIFTLYFPVTRKEMEDITSVPFESLTGNNESILVVDDVEDQRKIASSMLSKLGYEVTTVPSGEQAVEHMKAHSADLLILDMIMDPGIDGLETYKRILEYHPDQKAIIASGFAETERVKEVQRLGVGKYIKKPYTLPNIGIAVKEELCA